MFIKHFQSILNKRRVKFSEYHIVFNCVTKVKCPVAKVKCSKFRDFVIINIFKSKNMSKLILFACFSRDVVVLESKSILL